MSHTTDVSTYKFNHTMFRIKDPKVSLPWYEKVLGMKVGRRHSTPLQSHKTPLTPVPSQKFRESSGSDFTNFFLAFDSGFKNPNATEEEKGQEMFGREGILELCWNHGTGE
jgi:lactoylglutathione lyase